MSLITWASKQLLSATNLNSNFQWVIGLIQPAAQFTSASLSGATFSAGQLTGAEYVVFMNTNASPGTCTTRTATQMFGDLTEISSGFAYTLRLVQTGAGTMTLGAGSGVTLTGTMTVPTNTTRDFIVTFTSATTCTIQSVGVGTYS